MKLTFYLSAVVAASSAILSSCRGIRGPNGRIVGGTVADIKAFPFFVDLDGCGGSLIWEDGRLISCL